MQKILTNTIIDIKSVEHYLADLGYEIGLTGKDHRTFVKGFEPNMYQLRIIIC